MCPCGKLNAVTDSLDAVEYKFFSIKDANNINQCRMNLHDSAIVCACSNFKFKYLVIENVRAKEKIEGFLTKEMILGVQGNTTNLESTWMSIQGKITLIGSFLPLSFQAFVSSKSLSDMARKQKLFQSFSGMIKYVLSFQILEIKDDLKFLNVHRQSCKRQIVQAKED